MADRELRPLMLSMFASSMCLFRMKRYTRQPTRCADSWTQIVQADAVSLEQRNLEVACLTSQARSPLTSIASASAVDTRWS